MVESSPFVTFILNRLVQALLITSEGIQTPLCLNTIILQQRTSVVASCSYSDAWRWDLGLHGTCTDVHSHVKALKHLLAAEVEDYASQRDKTRIHLISWWLLIKHL